ncbi:MAG: nuclear transport factor 2 family protein [Magnetococcales bacterium]|nr:nuclear transport factor 2 family protein [Magnetococcales bacterium]
MEIYFRDPAKEAVWRTIRALNEAWTKGRPDDLADYFHRDMVALTPTDRHRLDGGAACVAAWKRFAETARIARWEERDPVIHLYGEAAVVAYDFAITFDMGGGPIEMNGRDLFFLVRQEGRWWVVADQFSPHPA